MASCHCIRLHRNIFITVKSSVGHMVIDGEGTDTWIPTKENRSLTLGFVIVATTE